MRAALEARGLGHVLKVACSAEVTTGAGTFGTDVLAKKVPERAWQKLSAGRGACLVAGHFRSSPWPF
ncbi:hypothetical protein ACF09J_34760 [Streptomyces sp. NPDC014889]|uniref:hypothetical protein n=1 Tax=Streptomyces sp. NPDC014889 TaxID=3364928 RepID=UPI003702E2FB